MPKGIRKSSQTASRKELESQPDDQLVPVGATHYPGADGKPGEAIPTGIAVRSRRGVQIEYWVRGRRCTATLPGSPTVRAVRAAVELRTRLLAAVSCGASDEVVERMVADMLRAHGTPPRPEGAPPPRLSRLARPSTALRRVPDEPTVGEALDEYLAVIWPKLSANSRRDYVGYVRARFKPFELSDFALSDDCFVAGRHSGVQPLDAGFTDEQSTQFCSQAWWPTSTVPRVREYVDIALEQGEAASTRRRRKMSQWRRNGGDTSAGLSPAVTKTVAVVRSVDLPLRCLAQLRVSQLSDVVAAGVVSRWRQTLHPKTVLNYLSFLRPAMQRLVDAGRLASNPFSGIKVSQSELRGKPRAAANGAGHGEEADYSSMSAHEARSEAVFERDDHEPDPLSDVEMLAVLERLDPPMRDHFGFAFLTGVRTGEQLALQRRDYDRHNSRIRVRRSLSRTFEKLPKNGQGRWVDLNEQARAIVERQLARCSTPTDHLFVNPHTGKPWRGPNKVLKRWRRALAAAGVRYRRPYHTRHTYATLMLLAGESPYYVASQLGHADLEMLERHYARWLEAGRGRKPGSAMSLVHASSLAEVGRLLGLEGCASGEGVSGNSAVAEGAGAVDRDKSCGNDATESSQAR